MEIRKKNTTLSVYVVLLPGSNMISYTDFLEKPGKILLMGHKKQPISMVGYRNASPYINLSVDFGMVRRQETPS